MLPTLALIYGGNSPEHEVSVISATNVQLAIDPSKYNVKMIFVPKEGGFDFDELKGVDVAFPLIHGSEGEDGSLQGALRLAKIPYVWPQVLSSAVCMDKDIAKRLLANADIPVAQRVTLTSNKQLSFEQIKQTIGLPFFIKPANAGSSVGVHKIRNQAEFEAGLLDAFQFDRKVICEENIIGREIECAVLGLGDDLRVSQPWEITYQGDFYSYETKYVQTDNVKLSIPADLPPNVAEQARELALKAFKTLECEIMARVDMFYTHDGRLVLNEVNTIPGFTNMSMYPKLMMQTGMSYAELVEQLIELALKKQEQ